MTFYRKERPQAVRHATMLEVNEFLVLDYVREHAQTNRTEIGRALGLSPASVSRIVSRLRVDGLITEEGSAPSSGGRPRTIVSFRHDAGSVVAVDLGGTRCHSALADLAGTIVAHDVRPTRDGGDAFATLLAAIGTMLDEASRRQVPVVSLAVGVPGIVDPESGSARDAPYVGWEGFPIVDRLASAVDVPFVVDNDVNLAALAHAWRGDGRRVDDFVTLSVGTGTGAAIVSNGWLLAGRHNAAGELGNLVVRREQLGRPITAGLGAFESSASGPGIAARARELVAAGRPSTLAHGEITPEAIFDAAAAGDELAHDIVTGLLDELAMAVIALICTVDPELVILEGGVGRSLEPYLPGLIARIEPSVPSMPRLVVSRLERDATVIGAVAAALELARRRAAPAAVVGAFGLTGVEGGNAR